VPGESGRVLVIEDNFLIAEAIAYALNNHGYVAVGPVPGLKQGLALATEEKLDAGLLDINLAGKQMLSHCRCACSLWSSIRLSDGLRRRIDSTQL
jgi:DNA-binding response OmpR family regulator